MRKYITVGAATVLAVFVFLMVFPSVRQEEEERNYMTINEEIAEVDNVPVVHSYVPDDSPRRPGEIRAIKYITIHETDNRSSGATARAHNEFLTGNEMDITGWHYTVDDHSIYHNIPDNEIAWNAGDLRERDGGNMNGIGIEMCVNLGGDYEKTMRLCAHLTAELLAVYNLDPQDVRMHSDFMDKVCPHRLITEGRVDEFLELVQERYREITEEG